jgi:nicotinic acid mononucleotide adenylyltransferase
VGTADLLDMLIQEEEDVDFSFAMGADTFMDLTSWKWRRSKDVLRLLGGRIVAFVRKQSAPTAAQLEQRVQLINEQEGAHARLVHNITSLQDVSSTNIRAMSKREELDGLVSPGVQDYIVSNKLYGFACDDEE